MIEQTARSRYRRWLHRDPKTMRAVWIERWYEGGQEWGSWQFAEPEPYSGLVDAALFFGDVRPSTGLPSHAGSQGRARP